MSKPRHIVWFSCGAASACVAKLAPPHAIVVYCDTMTTEHPDNQRFFDDVQRWIGKPITRIRSRAYASIDEVFERTGYMAGIKGARCTVEMKKVPRFEFQQPDDIHYFGLTFDEQKRIKTFVGNNPDLNLEWLLDNRMITKDMCYEIVTAAGIALPVMYRLGFHNNNCLGCVKATSAKYWAKIRRFFPEVFTRRARQSRAIGVQLVRYKGVRIFLDELPAVIDGDEPEEQNIECGPICIQKAATH